METLEKVSDEAVQKIERHIIETLIVDQKNVSLIAKLTILWLLKQTENLSKTAGVIIEPPKSNFRSELWWASHNLVDNNLPTRLYVLLKEFGTDIYPRHDGEVIGWGLNHTVTGIGEHPNFDKIYKITCPIISKEIRFQSEMTISEFCQILGKIA